ncbi:MAG TPA: hypothetical protein DCZ94_07315 [Lentisphaeria bacterium]|nr:MAG: hypothetical protein A2X48_20460 [Lentisphaerae bacterium GWF2_49_21]HBC86744.1 hypothetical protein [Lentisphaeria bacterium]
MAKKVLILDDEKGLRLILRTLIQRTGECEIFESDSLHEALSMCKSTRFDIIFLDHNVSDGIGWHIAEEIKKNPESYGSPKVIGMSGSVPYDTERKLFDYFFVKPFSVAELMPKLDSYMADKE